MPRQRLQRSQLLLAPTLDQLLGANLCGAADELEPLVEVDLELRLLPQEQEVRHDALELGELLLREVLRCLDRALVVARVVARAAALTATAATAPGSRATRGS